MKSSVSVDNMSSSIELQDKNEMARHLCPKCNRLQAWYHVEKNDLVQKCLCGYYKVVYTEYDDGQTYTQVLPANQVNMPKNGTRLSLCLGALIGFPGHQGTTGDVADRLNLTTPNVATVMMVLQHKGLVTKLEDNRGKTGGSVWKVTKRALEVKRFQEVK